MGALCVVAAAATEASTTSEVATIVVEDAGVPGRALETNTSLEVVDDAATIGTPTFTCYMQGFETKNKIVLVLVEIFGFGFCGIDHCFMGNVCLGIVKCVTLGGVGFW